MKKSRYLYKRGETYYFRFSTQTINVKLSLRTDDLYEARDLRDKILNNLSGSLMGKDILSKIQDSELLKQRAKEILEREMLKNNGILDLTDKQIDNYLPKNKRIKDQEFLELALGQRITVLERERTANGGKLPDFIIDDLKLLLDSEILYTPMTPKDVELMEKAFETSLSLIDGIKYKLKEPVEFYVALKEALFNISVEYLAKHYSTPVTPTKQDDYNKLINLGIIKGKNETQQSCIIPDPSSNTTSITESSSSSNGIKTLRQIVDEYIEEKSLSEDARANTIDDATKMLNLAIEFLGDNVDIAEANDRPLLLGYKKALKSLPVNRNKGKYRGIPIHKLARLQHNSPTMKTATTNKYLMYITSLFKYAEERDYISKSQAYRLQDKNKVHPRDQNDRFADDELVTLFTTLKDQYGTAQKQEKFWIPLVALFTSCRLNEICQLTYKDVTKLDKIWFFLITAEDEGDGNKSLKTVYSQRNIPIHKTLIDLGLIEYIQSKSLAPSDNLWGLKYEDTRNKYGRSVGRKFSELTKELFNPPPRRKTFHSLRHTFATFFRKVTDNELVMYFDGHSSNNQTFGRYAKYDDYKWMKSEIDKLKYPSEVEKMFKSWMRKNT
jgi:integrase